MKEYDAALALPAAARLAEGPLWNVKENLLYWVDIDGKRLHVYDPTTNADAAYETPGRIGVAAFMKDGRILGAIENGIFAMHITPNRLETVKLLTIQEVKSDQRFNDGECDPAGRFLVGSMSDRGDGYLFSIAPDGGYKVLLEGISCSNGIAFSPDQKTMYYIDTMTRQVEAFDYDVETGSISRRRVIRVFKGEEGYPDGMTVDRNGNLWVAHWSGYQASCFTPDGEMRAVIRVPVRRVSSVAFGGSELNTLYITTAIADAEPEEQKAQPLAGGLFRVDVGVGGIGPAWFG